MINEKDHCNYESCVTLKELGYDERCTGFFEVRNKGFGKRYTYVGWSNTMWDKESKYGEVISCPSLYEAQMWLIEKHGIKVLPRVEIGKVGYQVDVYDDCSCFSPTGWFASYEVALQTGVSEALKILEHKRIKNEQRNKV